MTIQQLADIASRYVTAMAEAMLAACLVAAAETGAPLSVPERGSHARSWRVEYAAPDSGEWDAMMRSNSDTRTFHM